LAIVALILLGVKGQFFASDLAEGRERLVEEMKKNPAGQTVLLSCDLREYGIERYGEKKPEGQAFMQWIAKDYQLAGRAGGGQLDPWQVGLAIYRASSQSGG
jgi:hypothetical protein